MTTIVTSLQTDDGRIFDNNFLFFVTVTATLDDSRRSSVKIFKEDHAFFSYGLNG
jgi:hypothetical protein